MGAGRAKDDDGGGAVSDLLVLSSAQLDHRLREGRGVLNVRGRGGARGEPAAAPVLGGDAAPARAGAGRALAAGWLTSISRRMALPSLVMTMPAGSGRKSSCQT